MMNNKLAAIVSAAALGIAATANATLVSYVGVQFDVEASTDTPTDGWRNPTPVKPLDIDEDNILGTDGYLIYFQRTLTPSYAAFTTVYPNRNNGTALWDNPTNPSGPDGGGSGYYHDAANVNGVITRPLLQFQITNPLPAGETLRLGILFDVISSGTASYTLEQTVGDLQSVTTPVFAFDSLALDVAFFDISAVSVGDTFVIRATNFSGTTSEQVAGITFDTGFLPIPEPSTIMLLCSGLGLIWWQRRQA